MSSIITAQVLSNISGFPGLPGDSWYFITAAALCVLNRPEEVALLLQHVITSENLAERLRMTRRIREALIKLAPVTGLPKTITSLLSLKTSTPPELLDHDPTLRTRDFAETPAPEVLARGLEFFDVVYGSKSRSLMKVMDNCGTPDLGAAGRLMYAFFLSNTSVLSGKETMFVTVTGAIAVDVQDVVLNHMNGAVRHGATKEEINAVRDLVVFLCKQVGMKAEGGGWRRDVARL